MANRPDLRKGLRKVAPGTYRVIGRKGWIIRQASKLAGEREAWQIAGWWYLEGPGGLFYEAETAREIRDFILDRIRPSERGGWV